MEFKFRVWDKVSNQMIYPFTGIGDDLYLSLECRVCSEDEEKQEDGSRLVYRGYRMIPLLFTRLKDKNGKEIYEGDIVVDEGKVHGEVYWNDEQGGFYVKLHVPKVQENMKHWMNLHYGVLDTPLAHTLKNFYVVGNIHENSELLESK